MSRPLILLGLSLASAVAEAPPESASIELFAPPTAMEPLTDPKAPVLPRPKTTLWSIGAPTNEEQYYLELINRARANPAAEGARLAALTDPDVLTAYDYWKVNLAQMQTEMAALGTGAPLAMNAKLLQSSRAHSLDQFTNSFQGHVGSNGSTISTRYAAAGYSAAFMAENVYVQSKSTAYGHAGFEVDWGNGSGGMQPDRGHRAIIHAGFREVGIGIYEGTKSSGAYGPQVVTQDFGVMSGTITPYVTGVAYYDFNANNFYDPGEGLGGVTVTVDGSSYHAVTASSGGYAVPVPLGAAARTVTFAIGGVTSTATANLTGTNNTKVDYKPAVSPAVDGTPTPVVSMANTYAVSTVPGASSYSWRVMKKVAVLPDLANDLNRITTSTSANYSVLNTGVKQEGTGSYHLAQPSNPPRNETLTYKATFRAGSSPSLQFQSRLRYAKTEQKALVQVSIDGGTTWSTAYTQSGSGGAGESAFTQRTVSLASVAGRDFLLRFNFTVAGSNWYTSTSDSTGWFIDSVTFQDVLDTTVGTVSTIPSGTTFTFAPAETSEYLLSGRSTIGGRTLPFGPAKAVTAVLPAGFTLWAATHETSAALPAGTLSNAAGADYNKDGVPNLMAYALGLSPVSQSAASLPRAALSGTNLRLDYPKLLDRTDITLTPQISSNLTTWYSPGQAGAPAGFTDSTVSTAGNVETRRAAVPVGSNPFYLRLKVTKP